MAPRKKNDEDPLKDKGAEILNKESKTPILDQMMDDVKTGGFEVESAPFNVALQFIGKHMKKSSLPVLENVQIKIEGTTLLMRRTDLEIDITASLPCSNVTGEIREFLVSHEKLSKIIKIISIEKIAFKISRKEVIIDEAWNTYSIASGPDPSQYMGTKNGKELFKLDVPAKEFKQILSDCIQFAASGEGLSLRPELGTVCMQLLKGDSFFYFVSTSLSTLYHNKLAIGGESPVDCSLLLPASLVSAITALPLNEGGVSLHVIGGDTPDSAKKIQGVWIEFGKYKISGRLAEGKYPDWQRIIPKNAPCMLGLDRAEFGNAVNKFVNVIEDPSKQMKIILNDTHISMISTYQETGSKVELKMDAKLDGKFTQLIDKQISLGEIEKVESPADTLGLNAVFVKLATSIMTGKNISIAMSMPNRPVIMKCDKKEDEHLFVLIMPQMIK